MHPFSYRLRVSRKRKMVSKCRIWEMESFHFTLVFFEPLLSNTTGEAKQGEQRAVGKRAMKILVWNPVESLSPGLLWTQSAGSCSTEEGLRRISSMQWFVGLCWRHTTPNFIVKGTYPAIDQNISVSAGIEPELSWYFQKDSCCFLWYEVRIN